MLHYIMSNPFEKKQMCDLSNPVYCLGCSHSYNEKPDDFSSHYEDEYCRYLGYCGEKCWDNLPEDLRRDMASYAYMNGDKVKRNHKFFMENIKGYSKPLTKN